MIVPSAPFPPFPDDPALDGEKQMKKQADIIWLAIVFMAQPGLVFGENERMEMKATGQIGAPNNTLHPLGKKQQRIDKAQGSLSMRE